MAIELKVPAVGESITEVEIGEWLKAKGDPVKKDEPVVTLESEKATVELPAPASGTLLELFKKKGDTAAVGEVIARIETDGQPPPGGKPADAAKPRAKEKALTPPRVMPSAERALAQADLRAEQVRPTGPGG